MAKAPRKSKSKTLPWAGGADDEAARQYKRRADYRVVRFDGERWHFFVNGYGLQRARDAAGKDVYSLFFEVVQHAMQARLALGTVAELDRFETAGAGEQAAMLERITAAMNALGFTKNMEAYVAFFYAGLATFYPDLTLRDLMMRVTPENQRELEPLAAVEIAKILRDQRATQQNGEAAETTPSGDAGN